MKIINNCCLNVGSKVRLQHAHSDQQLIDPYRIQISVSILPAVRSQSSTSVKHNSPNHFTHVRKECDLSGAQQLFTKPLILSFLFPLPSLCSLSSHSLDIFLIKLCQSDVVQVMGIGKDCNNIRLKMVQEMLQTCELCGPQFEKHFSFIVEYIFLKDI